MKAAVLASIGQPVAPRGDSGTIAAHAAGIRAQARLRTGLSVRIPE